MRHKVVDVGPLKKGLLARLDLVGLKQIGLKAIKLPPRLFHLLDVLKTGVLIYSSL